MSNFAEQTVRVAPPEVNFATDHLLVSNVRFLSMAGVVLVHCISASFWLAGCRPEDWLERAIRQPVSFDVIGFFLISGFLMEEGLARRGPAEYLRRRLRRIALPWLFWFSLYFAILITNDALHGRLRFVSFQEGALSIVRKLIYSLLSNAYWFVPNLLIALCILLACRRFRFDPRMVACALFALSLFYGVNIHANWIPFQRHSEALFGFVFYLWLGQWGARNSAAIQGWISRISKRAIIALGVLAGAAAFAESSFLFTAGNPHPMNTLRICNQLYAVILVVAIFMLRKPVWPRAVNVRATTFGVYLIHPIAIFILMNLIKRLIGGPLTGQPAGTAGAIAVCLSLCTFAAVYGGSLFLTKWLLDHPRLRWMVGAPLSN